MYVYYFTISGFPALNGLKSRRKNSLTRINSTFIVKMFKTFNFLLSEDLWG